MSDGSRSSASPALTVRRLSLAPSAAEPERGALHELSFDIAEGETYALVGEHGAGLTGVAEAIVGLTPATAERIRLRSRDRLRAEGRAQIVFRTPENALDPLWRVRDLIAEPLRGKRADRAARAAALLDHIGLRPSDADRRAPDLSPGECQRVALARAIAHAPDLVVLDHPTEHLDVTDQAHLLRSIARLRDVERAARPTLLLLVSDLAAAGVVADRIGVVWLGRLVEEADRDALFHAPLHPYTQALLDGALRPAALGRLDDRTPWFDGAPLPDPQSPPSGCPFHPHCPSAVDLCRAERPPATHLPGPRQVACHLVETGS